MTTALSAAIIYLSETYSIYPGSDKFFFFNNDLLLFWEENKYLYSWDNHLFMIILIYSLSY